MPKAAREKDAPTPEYDGLNTEAEAAQYVEDLHAADPQDSQLDTVEGQEAPYDPIVADAVRRAVAYVQSRRFGQATAEIIQYIASHAVDTAELNSVIMEQMALKILNAESADDVLDPFGTTKGRDLYNRPVWVTGCQFLDSTVEGEGFPWYVMLSVTDPKTKEVVPTTIGGEKLVIKAAGLDMHGGWPRTVMITFEVSKKDPTRKIHDLVLPA
jgi:hypothetical protein